MKILSINNDKGGVGKTFLATQLALYASQQFGIRVALFDLDSQASATWVARGNRSVCIAPLNTAEIFGGKSLDLASIGLSLSVRSLMLFPAPDSGQDLLDVVEKGDITESVKNLGEALKQIEPYFDLVIFDTNPNPDIRAGAPLFYCDQVVSPISLFQESINGIATLGDRVRDAAEFNPKLESQDSWYILPSMVDSSPLQKRNFEELKADKDIASILLSLRERVPEKLQCNEDEEIEVVSGNDDEQGNVKKKKRKSKSDHYVIVEDFVCIRRRNSFAEAQEKHLSVVDVDRILWSELKRPLFAILRRLNVDRPNTANDEMIAAVYKCCELYGDDCLEFILSYWLSGNPASLKGLARRSLLILQQLKKHISFEDLAILIQNKKA